MNKPKLTKDGPIKRFSISYNKAQSLGINDDDLDGIYEIGLDKFRISKRYKGERPTEVVSGLTNAINRKWEKLREIDEKLGNNHKKNEEVNPYIDLTVKEGFEKFFEYRQELVNKIVRSGGKPLLRRSTHEKNIITYKERHIRDSGLLDKKIIDVTDEDAQNFVDQLFSATKVDSDELLSENTINRPYGLIHLAFEYFKNTLKVISFNPFDNTTSKPKYKPRIRDYLAVVDIHYVLNEVEKKNIRFRTLINLALETGMRIEELTAIKYSDINRHRTTLNITRSVTKSRLTGELIVEDLLKTDASYREITISNYSLSLIDNYRRFKEQLGIKVTNDDFVFTAWDDNYLIDPDNYTEEWNDFLEELGYDSDDLPLRITRHSSATFMAIGETNREAIKRRFGWSKDSTVTNVYIQSNLDEDRRLLEKFDEEFRNAFGASYAELYCMCVNRFNNRRKLNNIMQKMLGKPIEDIDYDVDLKLCRDYLFEMFPIFNKLATIDAQLDDEEVEALLVGFKPIYKKIKLEPLSARITQVL